MHLHIRRTLYYRIAHNAYLTYINLSQSNILSLLYSLHSVHLVQSICPLYTHMLTRSDEGDRGKRERKEQAETGSPLSYVIWIWLVPPPSPLSPHLITCHQLLDPDTEHICPTSCTIPVGPTKRLLHHMYIVQCTTLHALCRTGWSTAYVVSLTEVYTTRYTVVPISLVYSMYVVLCLTRGEPQGLTHPSTR